MNKIAKRILALDETQEQFIQQCEDSGKFDYGQIMQIRWGFKNGLTMEQVKVYADPKFDGDQMFEIRDALKNYFYIKQKYNL